tara:strand:+ start:3535 stop:3924 length:390 start_codon:yes stop_codon:yes gene_type:complete
MIHDAFITHLQGAGLSAPVRNAFTTEPVENYQDEFPMIMVYPTADSLGENEANNIVIQPQTTEIAALIGCKLADLSTHVEQFRAASQGWVAGSNWDAMELSGGAIEGLRGEYIWWRETVTAQRSARQTL